MNAESDSNTTEAEIFAKYEAIAAAVCQRLVKNQRVRRNLPGGGRLRMDRQLPFLCLYRGEQQDSGTHDLITTEAAYLFASSAAEHHRGLNHLCGMIRSTMQEHFGTFLLLEVWSSNDTNGPTDRQPTFKIVCCDCDSIPSTITTFQEALESIRIGGQSASVSRIHADVADVRGLPGLSAADKGADVGCTRLGLIVNPIYRDDASNLVYPVVLQGLRWKLATALRKTIAEFTGNQQEKQKAHYDTLGPSSLVKATRLIDQQLCEVSECFDFVLQVTPTNADEAREQFKRSRSREHPQLRYRPLPYHPSLLKRRLFAIEIERIEDPTLAYLFWQKQDEIDRQLTSLRDLHAPEITLQEHPQQSNFLTSSLQLYGSPEDSLVELALKILQRLPTKRKQPSRPRVDCIGSETLVAAARDEIDFYHMRMNEFSAKVELSDSIASGTMISQDRLLIAGDIEISQRRVSPLLHHEIGTHLLTYFNGRCQPFRQLYAGLAGYEELQEGLAVLAEYLVGGLSRRRLRTLAARVMAVHWMIGGKSFASVFKRLHERHRFSRRQSFITTLRVFRGGGLTKDQIYLRGLRDLLDYLANGHDIEPLYVGKIGLAHIPYIQELRRRGIVLPPRILPRFLDDESVRDRLAACRGKSVLDLLETG